jgi:hypothetical protein
MRHMTDVRWWMAVGDDEMLRVLWAQLEALRTASEWRRNEYSLCEDLVSDTASRESDVFRGGMRTRNQILVSAIESTLARLTRTKPRPMFVTIDGNYDLQQRARKTQIMIDGEYEDADVYTRAREMVRDALTIGTGALKVYRNGSRVGVDRKHAGDLFVDAIEERRYSVRTLFELCPMDRGAVSEMFAGHDEAIQAAEPYSDPKERAVGGEVADMIECVEAWRLPSGPGAGDGRHVIAIRKAVLLDEPWEPGRFPFVFFHWGSLPRRFFGQSMVSRMLGTYSELQRMSSVIEECYRLMVPSVWVPASSEVNEKQIGNEPWSVYTYTGNQPPVYMTPPGISGDFAAREEALRQRAYQDQGISELSAASQKPAGLDSGKALRVHRDIESERFADKAQEYERAIGVEMARQVQRVLAEISESDDARKRYGGRQALVEVDAGDTLRDEDPYRIRVFPVSQLSETPEGKISSVQELVQLGVIQDPQQIREILDMPDLERDSSLSLARRRLSERLISNALGGQDVAASAVCDLRHLIDRGAVEAALAEMDGADEEDVQRLRDLISHAQSLMEPPAPPPEQMPSMSPGPAMPPGAP